MENVTGELTPAKCGNSRYDNYYRCTGEGKFILKELCDHRETGIYCPDCGIKVRTVPTNKKASHELIDGNRH